MGRDESLARLVLGRLPGIGPVAYSRLLHRFGSASAALAATQEAWGACLDEAVARKAYAAPKAWEWARAQIKAVGRHGARLLFLGQAEYPERLAQTHAPPPYIYVSGKADLDRPYIAVVGTRGCSDYGRRVAHTLATELAACGIGVVSGLARGIDTAAHNGTLEAGGQTVAVLASGVDRVYPAENAALHQQIRQHGAVVSEFAMGAKPEAAFFPRRNRLISGLSLGTLVVEAPARSGALITARYATEQNREVFAVPGDIFNGRSNGCHALLRDGAKLVESVDDIIEEIGLMISGSPTKAEYASDFNPTGPEEKLWRALEPGPIHIDRLQAAVEWPVGQVLGLLLDWELQGWIEQLPGALFVRRSGRLVG